MEEILQVENLTKIYGKHEPRVVAVNDISFSVKKESFTAIVGKSGSGKTTLLNCIGGLERPTSGDVIVDGERIYSLNDKNRTIFRRQKIGYVFQFFNLLSEMTVWENICIPSLIDKKQPDEQYIRDLVKQLGLTDKLSKYPAELSGGEQQRVAVTRALSIKPDILLADEPTGNLDRKNSNELYELLLFSNRFFKQTILLVTHDLDMAYKAKRIITLEDGRIISDTDKKGT